MCARLLQPPLEALPALRDLRAVLEAPLPARLPVAGWLAMQFRSDPLLAPDAALLQPEGESHGMGLSARLTACLLWD